ncbi:MAG TPA: radical SAM protein [Leptospiraceae bacterium]|nr:radical SAM protein [Leptospiraceae bacterium]
MSTRRIDAGSKNYFPAYTVWELTLKCDQSCSHCGSRAGRERQNELSKGEALLLADELIQMNPREVALIGGEAYLHEGFFEIIKKLTDAGIPVTMTTGGQGVTESISKEAVKSGLKNVSVSIDGTEEHHDLIRRKKGSFAAASRALEHLKNAGMLISSNININRINKNDLEYVYGYLKNLGVSSWQIQITVPLGRASDRPDMILQPWDLIELMPEIYSLKKKAFNDEILIMPGNNLGYFGPEEAVLRSLNLTDRDHWQGCQAGKFVMGIESDGGIKGCPSLQSVPYIGGNIREKTLDDIWKNSPEISFARNRTVEDLWGFCRTCVFASHCLGGCSFTAHSLFGRLGNNPYCHYRAKTLSKKNIRERLVLKKAAPGLPFDHGIYEIQEEPFDSDSR